MREIHNENVIDLLNSEIVGNVTGWLHNGMWRLVITERRANVPQFTARLPENINEMPAMVSIKEVEIRIMVSIEWHEMNKRYERVVQYIKFAIEDEVERLTAQYDTRTE